MDSNHQTPSKNGSGKLKWLALLIIPVVGAILIFSNTGATPTGETVTAALPAFEVKEGPLTISITESGTIQSKEQIIIKSKVRGRTTIIQLVEEGTRVKKGDLLIQLDSTELEDNRGEYAIRLENAEAAFIQEREELKIVESENESKIAQAELDYKFAKLNLQKYIEGEYPQALQEATNEISIASEELQRAQDKLFYSKELAAEGYITRTELQADEFAAKRRQLDLELAKSKLEVLEKYTHPQELESLEVDVEQKRRALERAKLGATASLVQAQSRLRAKESEFERERRRLAEIDERIANCTILAPADGMVVYATSVKRGWRGNDEPLSLGQEVRERQELIYLPTSAGMIAEVKIHESSLEQVQIGMPVKLKIDALPGKLYNGRITRIAPLPDQQSVWMNPDLKVYPTTIEVLGENSELRTGMSCQSEIIIREYDRATYIPLQAVIRRDGFPTVYVKQGEQIMPRRVELGLTNNRMVTINDGLKRGETVVLAPPLSEGTREQQNAPSPAKDPTPTSEEPASVAAKEA